MSDKNKKLTTASGIPISDNQNSLTAGERGLLVMQDFQLTEKLAHFNRERIPERVVHAKGSGAFGTLKITHDITKYSKAKLFGEVGKETPLLIRFSTVAGESGSADAERDVRGFSVKFYTEEGNWDVVGNNTPVFFIRDPQKFPDFIHSQKRNPQTNLRDATSQWDFWSLSPESLHQITILMSDRGLPKSYRELQGFGSHTYSFINTENERFWVKFHFKTLQGVVNNTNEEAAELIAKDRESHQRDLFHSIENGDFPKWRFCIQIMTEAQAETLDFNPFDVTKVWFYKDFPLIDVGIVELNRNPENYFAEIEQSAFAPSNIVPGISFSPDKMLQARIFAYADAQRYRLGANHQHLPVNRPHNEVNNHQRAGQMRFDGNGGKTLNYEPNSFDNIVEEKNAGEPPLKNSGDVDRYNHRIGNDDFSQAGKLFQVMSAEQQDILCNNIANAMHGVPQFIIDRQLAHFDKASTKYGEGVRKALASKK